MLKVKTKTLSMWHIYINCSIKPQSNRIVLFVDRTTGCDLVSYDRSAMFAAISFNNRTPYSGFVFTIDLSMYSNVYEDCVINPGGDKC